jgi:mRNA-degrading endonuclease RelE of RelBE toxin-antitoxin system
MVLYTLRFHPRFLTELDGAITYYNKRSKSTDSRFRSAIKKQLDLLKKAPHTRSIRYDDVRFARIEKFPYAIHYSIDHANNCVLVHSLLCDYQDPDIFWQKRM